VQHVTENKQQKASAQQRDAQLVDATAALGRGNCCGSLKLDSSIASNVSGSARVAVGQIAGSQTEVSVVVDALDINLMNSASSVTAGSGSSPRHDLGLTAVDGQAKSRFDFIDLSPANGCCDEGVNNGQTLIENQNFGLDEEQPSQSCCGGNNSSLSHPATVAVENDLNDKQNNDGQSQNAQNEGGSRSESIQIGHQTILPLLQTTSSVEGK
jgi:hypothetical protein